MKSFKYILFIFLLFTSLLLNNTFANQDTKTLSEAIVTEEECNKTKLMYIGLISLIISGFGFYIYKFRSYRKQKIILEKNLNKKINEALEINKEIENQKKAIELQSKEITDSIRYAKNIQSAILPFNETINQIGSCFVFFKPKDIVSGDFYWVKTFESGETIFATVDCTGHGVPGAFMSLLGYMLLRQATNEKQICDTNMILNFLDTEVQKILKRTKKRVKRRNGYGCLQN